MYFFNDFVCSNTECKDKKIKEIMHEEDEVLLCVKCKTKLTKEMPNPKGYVRNPAGTRCKQ